MASEAWRRYAQAGMLWGFSGKLLIKQQSEVAWLRQSGRRRECALAGSLKNYIRGVANRIHSPASRYVVGKKISHRVTV